MLERHITLNKAWKGNDHQCSLEPHQLRDLVLAVRDVEAAMGSPLKAFQPSEETVFKKVVLEQHFNYSYINDSQRLGKLHQETLSKLFVNFIYLIKYN